MSVKKRAVQIAVFLLIMFLTFYALFSGRDLAEIGRSIARMSPVYLIPSAALAVFFVCAEGFMIWFLLNAMREKKNSLFRCFQYSFIGFFYSGITPSASGGQPVQTVGEVHCVGPCGHQEVHPDNEQDDGHRTARSIFSG